MQELWKHAYQVQYGIDPDQEQANLAAKIEEWRINWQGGYDAGEDWATAMVADVVPQPEPALEVDPVPNVSRDSIIRIAATRGGIPYALPPDPNGVASLDCSLYVLVTYRDAGLPFPSGVRTAEQIRQACTLIGWGEIQPGDLLFFEQTYDDPEPPGPDGKLATHIGISLGAGTLKMWDAHDPGGVQLTDLHGDYWQQHLLEPRRAPGLAPAATPGLTSEPDHQFTLAELWPTMQRFGQQYGFDPQVLAAICYQESGFKNWRVHMDGTGFGLYGLDDNGLLPEFERWSGLSVGRGQNHGPVAPEKQTEYAAMQLRRYQDAYGDAWAAARAWHRGGGAMNDALGQQYEQIIRAHVRNLFA